MRLVRHLDGELDVVHELGLGGFDQPWASWTGARAELAGGLTLTVAGGPTVSRATTDGGGGTGCGRLRACGRRW